MGSRGLKCSLGKSAILLIKAATFILVQAENIAHKRWENLEGMGGEGGGRGDWDGEHMYTLGCFISMYDKIHHK